jgi:hypothetical protein
MKHILCLLPFLTLACGSDDGKSGGDSPVPDANIPVAEQVANIDPGSDSVATSADGHDGKDGAGCATTQTATGATIKCGDTTAEIKNGVDGTPGAAGKPGSDGEPTTYNEWYDPITHNMWLLSPASTWSAGCGDSGEWRYPTLDEALDAHAHGIFVAGYTMGTPIIMWTSELYPAVVPCHWAVKDTGESFGDYNTSKLGVFCVKEGK